MPDKLRSILTDGSAFVRPRRVVISPDELASRLFDICGSVGLLVFGAPLLLCIALVVKLSSPGPILFRQRRIGKNGNTFYIYKFRSMYADSDERLRELLLTDSAAAAEWQRDHKLRDDPRITPAGHILRKSSFDELPQFYNVLRGDMSIVGPRPIVAEEASKYGAKLRHYASVKPGITGLWQVSGRNDVSYQRRVAMDVLYARRKSFLLDLKITLKTVPAVLSRKGSY